MAFFIFIQICDAVALYCKPSPNIGKLLLPLKFHKQDRNLKNIKSPANKTGLPKGVMRVKKSKKLLAKIKHGKEIHLGCFPDTPEGIKEAALNYDYYAKQRWGDKCYLNYPDHDFAQFKPKRKIHFPSCNS